MAILGQFRGDLRSNWESTNPVIHDREFILVKETANGPWTGYKVGDGVNTFKNLPYGSNISVLQVIGNSETATMSQNAITQLSKQLETESIAYFTGGIYFDFASKQATIGSGGYFFNGANTNDGISVSAHTVNWTTSNMQYMYFSPTTKLFYIQDYSLARVNSDDVMIGVVDQNGGKTQIRGRAVDLGKSELIFKSAYLTSNGVVLSLEFSDNGGFKLSNTAGFVATNQGSDYITINAGEIDKTSGSQNTQYVFFDRTTNKLVTFDYNAKPNQAWTTMYFVGIINPSLKLYNLNAFQIKVNGDTVQPFYKSQADDIASATNQLGTPETSFLPSSGWIDKSWNTVLGTDGIFIDKRCIISKDKKLKNIRLVVATAGVVRIHLMNSSFETLYSQDFTLAAGIVNAMINGITYSTNLYVGIQNVTGIVRTISPADNTGNGYKKTIATGAVAVSNYSFAYELEVEDYTSTLEGRVTSIENQLGTSDDDLQNIVASGKSNIQLAPKEYVLNSTLNIPSGTKISGVRGKTIIRVSSGVKVGINLKNIEDVVLENLTIIGAYNGTPIKSGLQPVRSGIINDSDEAYDWQGAGYNTDMTNGGVTSEYIPQVGININTCEKVEILGCEIKNFSWAGIMNRLSGKNYRYAIKIQNNYINNCYCGIKLYDEAERSQYIANNIALCQIGLFLDSGTNMFYGTSFTANRIGMVMSNGWNHAHGEFTDCPFTHCSLFGILAKNIEHGQVFNGCKIGYVDGESGNFGGICFLILNSRGIAWFNGKLINANIKFDGKFYLHGVSYNATGAEDQFGNYNYVMTFEDVSGQPTNYNGGVNQMKNNTATGASFQIVEPLDATNVILKDNFYISGQDSTNLNN